MSCLSFFLYNLEKEKKTKSKYQKSCSWLRATAFCSNNTPNEHERYKIIIIFKYIKRKKIKNQTKIQTKKKQKTPKHFSE